MFANLRLSRWFQILAVAGVSIIGVGFYTHNSDVVQNGDALGLQRIDLLYLNEPAPSIDQFDIARTKAVIVFCDSCQLPIINGAKVIRNNDPKTANQYALKREDGQIGPGFAVIDSRGFVRYRTYDKALHEHAREINRLVAGLE
jgi:hypothetical protein